MYRRDNNVEKGDEGEEHHQCQNTYTKGRRGLIVTCRFKLGLIMFLANVVLYLNRVNINMVIVCMLDVTQPYTDVTMTTYIYNNTNVTIGDYSVRSVVPEFSVIHQIDRQGIGTTPENTQISNISPNSTDESHHRLKFQWSKSDVSLIFSSYYYGCILTQIPGGHLAHRFGGKHVMTTCCIFTLIGTILTPLAASHSVILLCVVRFLLGAAGGLFAPTTYVLIVNWTTSTERASILGLAASGQPIGIVLSFISSGFFCSLGWSTIFYVHGAVTFVFMCVWLYEVYNTPQQHPRIQCSELEHLNQDRSPSSYKIEALLTPWTSMVVSRAVWVTVLAHFAYLWSYYTFIINIPMFMKEVFGFVIEKNGVMSALPYIFSMISLISVGTVSGLLIHRRCISLKSTRKLFAGLGLCGTSACLIGAGYVQYEHRYVAVGIICFSCICSSLTFGGILPTYADIAGVFSGTIFAIGNTFGMLAVIVSAFTAGVLTPNVSMVCIVAFTAGVLTPNGLQEEWQRVFYVAASLNILSMVVFVIFGRTSLQSWALVDSYNETM